MLGSNDAKSRVESVDSYFEQDLLGLLRYIFAQRNTTRCTWLLLPPSMHAEDGTFNLRRSIISSLPPRIRNVGRMARFDVIDTRSPLELEWRRAFGMDGTTKPPGDGVHPPALGMRRIAEKARYGACRISDQNLGFFCYDRNA
jgi:lysophospholipase L1-like esterase